MGSDSQPPLRRFLKLDEVAEVLATTPAQVYALVRRGELAAIKLGGRGQWRIENSVLDEYIDRQYEATRDWVATHPFSEKRQQGPTSDEPTGVGDDPAGA